MYDFFSEYVGGERFSLGDKIVKHINYRPRVPNDFLMSAKSALFWRDWSSGSQRRLVDDRSFTFLHFCTFTALEFHVKENLKRAISIQK